MSTHQQTKPRRANQSMTDESARPGTVRSKVGCEAIDEPCTNSTAGLPSGADELLPQEETDVLLVRPVLDTGDGKLGCRCLCVHVHSIQSIFAPVSLTTFAHR